MAMATLVPLHVSEPDGESNVQAEPHSTVLSGAQVNEGGVVSSTVMVWLHVLELPQASVASQARVMIRGQTPLVTVSTTVIVTLVLPHVSNGTGESKLQVESQSTVLFVAQFRERVAGLFVL